MNINKATFNGIRIKVTYKCGHVQTELSRSDQETHTRQHLAAKVDCSVCAISSCTKQTALRPVSDPISQIHYKQRSEGLTTLTARFNTLRTH